MTVSEREQFVQSGTFFSGAELEARILEARRLQSTRQDVEDVLSSAEAKSRKIEREAKKRRSLMESAARREIQKEMAETKRLATILAVKEVLANAAKAHEKIDALTPWIEELVETCVRRIVGEMPQKDAVRGMVVEAITRNKRGLTYVLRAGIESFDASMKMAQELEKTEFKGLIMDVNLDRDLPADAIILVSTDGAMDISLETQLKSLEKELGATFGASDAES